MQRSSISLLARMLDEGCSLETQIQLLTLGSSLVSAVFFFPLLFGGHRAVLFFLLVGVEFCRDSPAVSAFSDGWSLISSQKICHLVKMPFTVGTYMYILDFSVVLQLLGKFGFSCSLASLSPLD